MDLTGNWVPVTSVGLRKNKELMILPRTNCNGKFLGHPLRDGPFFERFLQLKFKVEIGERGSIHIVY